MKSIIVPQFVAIDDIITFGAELLSGPPVSLDFSYVGFAKPTGMVLLSQFVSKAVELGLVGDITGVESYGYPANVGFFEACSLTVPRYAGAGGENYIPVHSRDLAIWRAAALGRKMPYGQYANHQAGRPAYLVTRTTKGDLFELVKYCIREIVRNSMEHGGGKNLCMAGQYWPQRHEVELCIYDNGIGVLASISENEKFRNVSGDDAAIRLAVLPSTSGKKTDMTEKAPDGQNPEQDWGNSGFGLYVTSQLARESGRFFIGSGDRFLDLRGTEKRRGDFGLNGTLISMSFDVEALERTANKVASVVGKGESFARRHVGASAEVMASAASKFIMS